MDRNVPLTLRDWILNKLPKNYIQINVGNIELRRTQFLIDLLWRLNFEGFYTIGYGYVTLLENKKGNNEGS